MKQLCSKITLLFSQHSLGEGSTWVWAMIKWIVRLFHSRSYVLSQRNTGKVTEDYGGNNHAKVTNKAAFFTTPIPDILRIGFKGECYIHPISWHFKKVFTLIEKGGTFIRSCNLVSLQSLCPFKELH